MKTFVSRLLWTVAIAAGLAAAVLSPAQGCTPTTATLFLICLVVGLFGLRVDRSRRAGAR